MSFSAHARRAGDPAVPLPHRLSSFRSCVRGFPPASYEDTVRYLRLMAGPFERDERALAAALELLLVLRARWKAEVETFAAIRRIEKRRGRRKPRGTTPFGGPDGGADDMALLRLHTPRGAERADVRHLLPGGNRRRFAGSSFELAAPVGSGGQRSGEPFEFDGSSFELRAQQDETSWSWWPARDPRSDA